MKYQFLIMKFATLNFPLVSSDKRTSAFPMPHNFGESLWQSTHSENKGLAKIKKANHQGASQAPPRTLGDTALAKLLFIEETLDSPLLPDAVVVVDW